MFTLEGPGARGQGGDDWGAFSILAPSSSPFDFLTHEDLAEFASLRILNVERVMGIEPTYQAWEARVLPLNYTRELK